MEHLHSQGGDFPKYSLDTETTGVRPYHGDRLISIIIGYAPAKAMYFNFWPYAGEPPENVLSGNHLDWMNEELFSSPHITWYMHWAPFDLSMLRREGIEIEGVVHCTKTIARVEYNDHLKYSLDACAKRIGYEKDNTVETYIEDHKLWEWIEIPGKKTRKKNKFFQRVPLEIIVPYGERDANITRYLGQHQEAAISAIDLAPLANIHGKPRVVPFLANIVDNERRLTKTVSRIHHAGLLVDRKYCSAGAAYETDRNEKAAEQFKVETGREFKSSGKLFAEVFSSDSERWVLTDKGNPSFESDVLKTFKNPAAKAVLDYRDAKSKADFYRGFLYHADSNGFIHPSLDPGGTGTGRFAGFDPNFQNLTSEDILVCRVCGEGHDTYASSCKNKNCRSADLEEKEFIVRKAIIPPPGYCLIMPDYDQMEYRLMFEFVCRHAGAVTEIVTKILGGHDPHQATADVVTAMGFPLSRKHAKNGNFAILYGAGPATLAATIGCTVEKARELRDAIFRATPEMRTWITAVIDAAERSGHVVNWAGRRYNFPVRDWSYRAPNYLIQGGSADVVKMAMNRIDDYLKGKKSKMVLQVHDELPTYVHESEIEFVPKAIKDIMEGVFPAKYLPLTCGMEYSWRSMAHKNKGYPCGAETGDSIPNIKSEAILEPA